MELLILLAVVVIIWLVIRAMRRGRSNVRPMTERQRDYIVDLLEDLGNDDPDGAHFDGKPLDELDVKEASQVIDYLKGRLGRT